MSSAEASPARTSHAPARARALKGSALAYGASIPALLASFDPASSSWRTSQRCLVEGWASFSETWPRSGLMRNGIAYQLPPLVPLTGGTEFGLWPTPCLPNDGRSVAHVDEWRGRSAYHKGKKVQVDLNQAIRLWPTPTVYGLHNQPGASQNAGWGLSSAVKLWPTPRKSEAMAHGKPGRPDRGRLEDVVANETFATPTARDWRSGKASPETMAKNSRPLSEQIGGSLNPTWVEWLMGFPLGWTALEPSETQSSRKSRRS